MKHAGVIGHPVGHSVSPILQQAAFDYCGIPARYELWDTSPTMLEERIRSLRASDHYGAQVTIPHKLAVLKYVDRMSADAQLMGACNMIHNSKGVLVAHNFDAYGFMTALKGNADFDPMGKTVLLIGAGGAACAVTAALASERIRKLVVLNRTTESALRLCELATRIEPTVVCTTTSSAQEEVLKKQVAEADLIVNATPAGMAGGGLEQDLPLSWSVMREIRSDAIAYDLVFRPLVTPFLIAARIQGAKTQTGIEMLVYLGAKCFEVWTGESPPVDVMMQAALQVLYES